MPAAQLVLILLGLWQGTRPGSSIFFLGILVGVFLLIFPDKLMKP